MTFLNFLKTMFTSNVNRTEVVGAPPSLKEFEKLSIHRAQEEMKRTLQILELEQNVVERK